MKQISKKSLLKLAKRSSIILLVSLIFGWWILPLFFTIPNLSESYPEESSILYDRNHKPVHHHTRDDFVRHQRVDIEDIPKTLLQATLAAEDKRFNQHGGVDVLASLRAIKQGLSAREIVSGASTITQQTIKLTGTQKNRTIKTKLAEALKARKLEMFHSKDDILQLYFNLIEYGNRTQGPVQAAAHYFNKPLDQLSLAEYALLAGLPQAPTRHNPRTNPEGATKRRNWILDRMQAEYQLPDDQIKRAKSEPLNLHSPVLSFSSPELAELLKKQNSKVHTTIDLELQKNVVSIAQTELTKLKAKNVNNAAVVVIHNPTGEILTLLGSPNSRQSPGGEYNAALLPRSPGSALKPFTYLLGFEQAGLNPSSIIPDIPTWYAGDRGPEEIVNFDRKHHGPVTIQRALGSSLNIPVVRVLNEIGGPSKLQDYLQTFGFTTLDKDHTEYGLGLTIGAGEVTLLELTNAYATIARLGNIVPASLTFGDKKSHSIASANQCYLIADILSNNHARSHTFGSNSHLRLPFTCAVKTGTSTDYKDNFCVGFTQEFTVGVWVGNISNTPMHEVTGVTGAGPIFKRTMLALHQEHTPTWFTPPKGILSSAVDPHTGKALHSSHPRFSSAESVKTIYPIEEAQAQDYQQGLTVLDQRYVEWMKQPRPQFILEDTEFNNAPEQHFRVLSPTQDATYYLDPDLPDAGAILTLKSTSQTISWNSETLEITNDSVQLNEGIHSITGTCRTTGRTETIQFSVQTL